MIRRFSSFWQDGLWCHRKSFSQVLLESSCIIFSVSFRAGFAIVLGIGFVSFLKFLLYVIFIDCIGVGLLIATTLWLFCNKYLVTPANIDVDVEWGYCFDVHLKYDSFSKDVKKGF